MEQKKLLLVAISVGVFLVIVIGAAILAAGSGNSASAAALAAASAPRPIPAGEAGTALSSAAGAPAYTQETAPRDPLDAAGLLRNPDTIPGLNPAPDGVPLQQNNFYINGSPERASPGEARETGTPQTVITVAPRTAAGVPDEPPAGRAVSRPPAAPASAVAALPAPSARPAAAARPARTNPPAAKPPETTAKVYDNYWVQTGSFSVKARAEGAKEILASKGISSIIENREIDKKTFFRVRVGPYTSQNEADYWLSLIKSIKGFENSQVWKSQMRQ
jgi:DedD protein